MVALKTFNNLSEERKAEIIRVCLEEFALFDYESASLSRIIKNLNLAKGSWYRYFENKQSLYFFLLEHCVQKRIENNSRILQHPSGDFYELILQNFEIRIHFDEHYPLHSAFLYNVLQERNSEELGNIQFTRKQKALEIILKMLDGFMEQGQVRDDVEKEVMAWHILQTQLSIVEFLEQRFQQDIRKNIKEKRIMFDIPKETIMPVARQFVILVKDGLSPQTNLE